MMEEVFVTKAHAVGGRSMADSIANNETANNFTMVVYTVVDNKFVLPIASTAFDYLWRTLLG
jgi:hypothetical protein